VLEGARVAGARKVVYAATAAEPPALHAVSKGVVVEYLQAYRALHDLEYTALGLANVYGPRQRRGVVAEFAERLLAGEPCTLYGDGRQTRDHVFVDDVVDAFVRAGQRGSGVLCNVGTGVETATRDLHAAMAAQAGVTDAEVVLAPARPGDTARSVLDPGRASIHLGWAPWTSLADGLAQVLRENLHNR
jgi:UDP-glucose 4-epimerase